MMIIIGNIIKIAHTHSPTIGYDFLELITEVRRELAWLGKSAFTYAAFINSIRFTTFGYIALASPWQVEIFRINTVYYQLFRNNLIKNTR